MQSTGHEHAAAAHSSKQLHELRGCSFPVLSALQKVFWRSVADLMDEGLSRSWISLVNFWLQHNAYAISCLNMLVVKTEQHQAQIA